MHRRAGDHLERESTLKLETVTPSRELARGRRERAAGTLLLAIATGAALALALRHVLTFALPGCGFESGCERAFASAWAKLPALEWPVAFLGLSWFAALLLAWLCTSGAWPRALTWITRVGALASLAFLTVMLVDGAFCAYCAVVHACNLAFLVVSERRSGGMASLAPLGAFAGVFVVSSAGLWAWREQQSEAVLAREERELARTQRELRAGGARKPFTGRQRLGPEDAPIRIVVFSDYECRDCALIEQQLALLMERRDDVSLSVKHFPLCRDCNTKARELGLDPHPNACKAARAAEAAGIVAGSEGFWRMHRWLFERAGVFDERELAAGLELLDLPQESFFAAMHGSETQALVEADVAEALELGINSTPLIYLNGVELRGWKAPDAIARAVGELALHQPAPASAERDAPPLALEKFLEDWRSQPELSIPPAARDAARPAGSPRPQVVLFGDYLDENSRELDRRVRAAIESLGATYSFRAYPMDAACGPGLPGKNPGACLAARAAEAAWTCGGDEAFARMHAWLMEERRAGLAAFFESEAVRQGLDGAAFARALGSPATLERIRSDVERARALDVKSIPALFVGGRLVPRWKLEGERVPELAIEELLTDR